MGTCVDISIYISRLRNAEGGHVIGRSLYVVYVEQKVYFYMFKVYSSINTYIPLKLTGFAPGPSPP